MNAINSRFIAKSVWQGASLIRLIKSMVYNNVVFLTCLREAEDYFSPDRNNILRMSCFFASA
jgi:hypothetical protein